MWSMRYDYYGCNVWAPAFFFKIVEILSKSVVPLYIIEQCMLRWLIFKADTYKKYFNNTSLQQRMTMMMSKKEYQKGIRRLSKTSKLVHNSVIRQTTLCEVKNEHCISRHISIAMQSTTQHWAYIIISFHTRGIFCKKSFSLHRPCCNDSLRK